jgi:hypothetical protein
VRPILARAARGALTRETRDESRTSYFVLQQ